MATIAEYRGPFGKEQAERLLWRAGFGAKAGEAEGLDDPRAHLVGP